MALSSKESYVQYHTSEKFSYLAMLKHFAEFVLADVLRKGYHVCVIINAGEKKSWIKVLPM